MSSSHCHKPCILHSHGRLLSSTVVACHGYQTDRVILAFVAKAAYVSSLVFLVSGFTSSVEWSSTAYQCRPATKCRRVQVYDEYDEEVSDAEAAEEAAAAGTPQQEERDQEIKPFHPKCAALPVME